MALDQYEDYERFGSAANWANDATARGRPVHTHRSLLGAMRKGWEGVVKKPDEEKASKAASIWGGCRRQG
jgi:hypothetical protein